MELIVILVCLGLERYGHLGAKMATWQWFDSYIGWLKSTVGKSVKLAGWQGIFIAAAPVLLVVGVLYYWLHTKMYGLLGFLLSIVILLYCLGTPAVSGEKASHEEEKGLIEGGASAPATLWQANETLFAVLFWFVVLGPFGALFYRVMNWIHHKAQADKSLHSLLSPAKKVEGILDWLPARMVAFGYALMGNFSTTFRYWLENVWSGVQANRRILMQCGARALGLAGGDDAEQAAQSLVDRTLLLFIVVVAIFTVIAWL